MSRSGRIKNVLPNAATIIDGDSLPVTGGTLGAVIKSLGDVYHSENLLNENDPDFIIGYYMAANGTLTQSASYFLSGYIPVTPGQVITAQTELDNPGTRYLYGMRFVTAFNASKVAMTSSGSNTSLKYYIVPEDVAYVRLSLSRAAFISGEYALRVAVVASASCYPYTPHGITNARLKKNVLNMAFPNSYYSVVGMTTPIYFQNLIDGDENDYYIYPNGTLNISDMGKSRVVFITNSTVTYGRVAVEIFDKNTHEIIAGRYAVAYVSPISNAAGSFKVLHIGDSVTSQGHMLQRLVDLSDLETEVMKLELIGSLGTAPKKHEGRAGWSTGDYMAASKGGTTNAFYNSESGVFDFAYYMAAQGYAGVDVVIISLGINDFANITSDEALEAQCAATAANLLVMINSIKAYNANQKIFIDCVIPANENYAPFAASFGQSQTPWRYRRNNIRWNNYLIDKFSPIANVYIIATNAVVDCKNNIGDNVHPTAAGGAQMADQHWAALKYVLNE